MLDDLRSHFLGGLDVPPFYSFPLNNASLLESQARRRPVLVIDDEPDIRDVLRDLLTDEGYQVLLARDGAEGLRLLEQADQPMVVLLDLMMPHVDGFEVCRRLAADPKLRDNHAVVLMSAHRNLRAADQTAVTASLPKPFDVDVLLALVERLAAPSKP